MLAQIFKIAFLCITIGSASIPLSFDINNNPFVVWTGNALGSLVSAVVVIMIGNRITNQHFKDRISKRRVGKKIVTTFDEGQDNKNVVKAGGLINRHGLKIFSLLCPIFPGVLISTVTVYILNLDKRTYSRWMFAGVVFVSGAYVFGFWWLFVK